MLEEMKAALAAAVPTLTMAELEALVEAAVDVAHSYGGECAIDAIRDHEERG